MCQTFATCYSTVAILTRYEREWQMFILFFYSSFSLLPSHISLSVYKTSLSLFVWFSHRPFSLLSVLFPLLSLSQSIPLRSAWRVWSSGDQHGWVVGLMLEQWVVGGRQRHLGCRVSSVRFACHGWWALLAVGLGGLDWWMFEAVGLWVLVWFGVCPDR